MDSRPDRTVPLWAMLLLFLPSFVWVFRWKIVTIAAVWWTVSWLHGRMF